MSIYILSKMSHGVSYRFYKDVSGLPIVTNVVTIHGGADLPSEKSGFGDMMTTEDGRPIWTADGVVTAIPDSAYEYLKDHTLFKKHVENNHLKIVNHDISQNYKEIKKLSSDMETDGRGQLDKKKLQTKVKASTVKKADDEDVNRI